MCRKGPFGSFLLHFLASSLICGSLLSLAVCGEPIPGADTAELATSAGRTPNLSSLDYDQHVADLKKRLPSSGFTIVVERPFVVVGDEPPETVKRRAEHTVKWSVEKLKQNYFANDPAEILDIWLFKDDASYRKHAQQIFGDTPSTPYGYFSSSHKALIMNIGTGGGTLVHEIVHPFMRANFPSCPAWFNEGMGSLYEQSGEVAGQIHGFPNWRLPGLQKAIRTGTLQSFKELTGTTDDDFYSDKKGVNYAQARYLCYYLQEKDLLVKFYKDFSAGQKSDPSGYKTLQRILGESDMSAFQRRWEQFVLALRQ
ncbi:MAG TPA: hypothetical protein VFV34_03395 [Blastocatellia bacterium]|nr:hypothetical protein [Blastocatellia bacterium]